MTLSFWLMFFIMLYCRKDVLNSLYFGKKGRYFTDAEITFSCLNINKHLLTALSRQTLNHEFRKKGQRHSHADYMMTNI